MPGHPRIVLAVLLYACVWHSAAPARAAVSPEEVRQALDAGIGYIKSRQAKDGSWPETTQAGGVTALSTFALLQAQVPANDPVVAAGLAYLERVPDEFTYVVSLKIAAFAHADAIKYQRQIQDSAKWLCKTQLPNGQWTYGAMDPRSSLGLGDNSNTQFALIGLHEAASAGANVPRAVWTKAARHWLGSACKDGSWQYVGAQGTGTGSMTAAGVASLLICGQRVTTSGERGYHDGVAPGCGQQRTNPVLAGGLRWLGQNFSASRNPRSNTWNYYWLYAVERAGMMSGLRYFGEHDWYREGAEFLVNQQDGGGIFARGGSWNGNLVDTCFAVLFLAKGRRPILIQKLRWSEKGEWNNDPHDCENLVASLGDALGEPVAWQAVDRKAPIKEWLEAPILYITGHTFPEFTGAEQRKIREFVEAGGFLFVEACCSRAEVRTAFERFAAQTFRGYPLVELEAEHPIWTSLHRLKPGPWPLYGIDVGCRTSVVFSPRDLSCLWEQADVPQLSEQALHLGANIAAYATGREPLRDKLAEIVLPKSKAGGDLPVLTGRGALQIVQLSHAGDWKPDPGAMTALAELLRKNANVDVVPEPAFLRPTDPEMLDHPVAYLTGHFAFDLSADDRAALSTYLRRGGFLFVEACCGREAFGKSARKLAKQLYPNAVLKRLPPDHPILRGEPGFDLRKVTYRAAVERQNPKLTTVELWGVEDSGRLVLVFSPFGMGCGLEDHKCFNCRGLVPEDARKLAVNIVLYALSN